MLSVTNINDEPRYNTQDAVSELSVTGIHFDRQSHTHHMASGASNEIHHNITQVSEQIEGRITKKLSQEFNRIESRISDALSKLDEFLSNQQIQTHSKTVPGTFRNTNVENQGTNEDDSQSDPHPEAGIFHGQTTQNSSPKEYPDNNTR